MTLENVCRVIRWQPIEKISLGIGKTMQGIRCQFDGLSEFMLEFMPRGTAFSGLYDVENHSQKLNFID